MATETTTTIPSFDRGAIMRRAWDLYRRTNPGGRARTKAGFKMHFAARLRQAWAEARAQANTAPVSKVERLKTELFRLEHTDAFSGRVNARMATIRTELAQMAA